MAAWPAATAKARFSELLDACVSDGPQVVSRRGTEAAVLVSMEEWRRLHDASRPTLKGLLTADAARFELDLPVRGQASRRPAEEW